MQNWLRLFSAFCLLPSAFAGFTACSRRESPPPQTAQKRPHDDLPPRDRFAGSEVCGDCHQKNYERWRHDWHSKALAKAAPDAVLGKFANAHFKGGASEAWFEKKGEDYLVRTRNRDGQLADYRVDYVIGAKRMQDPVTVFPDGRWQVLPVYFHVTGGGAWVDYNEAKQGKIAPDHPYFWTNFRRTANKECIECHATGVDVRYDRAAHEWTTSMIDAGVACEACHGPGARHTETKEKGDILRADHLPKDLELSICARCHGPRDPLYPLLDTADQFRPGQRYEDKYQPLVVTDSTERSGEFFADGRPNSSSFEYQALIQSRCHLSGGATCLTCHTAPHEDHAVNEIRGEPNASCRNCHKAIDPAAHSHHRGATCVDCHMPKLISGVLDKFADHSIDIPNPRNTARHNVPNACGLCHRDKTPLDLQQEIDRWWPGSEQRQQRRITLADAIDETTRAQSENALSAVIGDRNEAPSLRGAAAILLAQRFPQAARVSIPMSLPDRSPLVRSRFIEAIGYSRDRSLANDVAKYVDDGSVHVRQMAALVLASFGDARGEAAIRRLATDARTRALIRPHISLAITAANRGDLDTAQRELEFVVSEAPYVTDSLVMLGDIRARRGDFAGARSWFEEALRFDPSHRGANARMRALAAAGAQRPGGVE